MSINLSMLSSLQNVDKLDKLDKLTPKIPKIPTFKTWNLGILATSGMLEGRVNEHGYAPSTACSSFFLARRSRALALVNAR